jgi:hypothetical protein
MYIEKNKGIQIFGHLITGEQLYFLGFTIYFLPSFLLNTMFTVTIGGHQFRLLSYAALPFILCKVFIFDKWNVKQLFLIALSFFISLVIWRTTQNVDFVFACVLVVGAKGIEFRKIISWFFYLSVVCLVVTTVCALVGVIPNLVYYSPVRPTRYALGMSYATYSATIYLYIVLAYCYLRFGNLKLYDYIVIIVFDCLIMWVTNTRLDFIAVFLVIPLIAIAQNGYKGNYFSRLLSSFYWMATPIMATLMIILSYFYSSHNRILYKINKLFSGRLLYGRTAFKRYDLSLLGRKIVEHTYSGLKGNSFQNNPMDHLGINYFFIDSSYIRMLLVWGVIAFLIVIVAMTKIAITSTINKTYVLSAIMFIVAINCMFEPYIIHLVYNPFLLALFAKETSGVPFGGKK